MIALVWFFRLVSFPLGLACLFVSLDMLYVWGLDGRTSRRRAPKPTAGRRPPGSVPGRIPQQGHSRPSRIPYRGREQGVRPHPDTWIWWEWRVRRPAFYLLFLSLALFTIGVLMCLPGFGRLGWVSERIEGLAVLVLGLILLRGTIKITSLNPWKKITIIKRPLSGKARPSWIWMGLGLALCVVGLYGLACDFASPANCIGGKLDAFMNLGLTVTEFILAGISAMGLEETVQSWQEHTSPEPRSVLLFGVGLVLFIAVLMARAMVL